MRTLTVRQRFLGVGAFLGTLSFVALGFSAEHNALGYDKPASPFKDRAISYLKEVRPIFAQHCFQCHGPDEAARKGKLRLDLKENVFAARKSKHVVAAGDLNESLVWNRISTTATEERMPPVGKAEPLTEKQIAVL